MPTIRRLWGFVDDATAGGSSYDDLTGVVPGVSSAAGTPIDSTAHWPVTGGNIEFNVERIDRDEEVRGRRARTAPRPFRAAPVMTVPMNVYRSAAEKVFRKTLGGTSGVPVGTAPASMLHTFPVLGFGSTALPAIHTQLVRDDLNHKMSGGSINSLSMSFPLDGEGTMEFEIWGLYAAHFASAAPTATLTGFSEDVMMLRDAQVQLDTGSGLTTINDLEAFEFSFTNNLNRKWYAKRNVVTQVLGTAAMQKTYKLWFPEENKLGAAQDVTYAIQFGNPNAAQELARDFAQVQKMVFEITGGPLGTTPAASELIRITIYNGVHTGGGAEALTAREDMTARFEGGGFYSDADSADIKVEVVNATATAIT
jgi:hypothetical protein